MKAVRKLTTAWRALAEGDSLTADEVAYDGAFVYAADKFTPLMVWDAALTNVRPMTAGEIAALPSKGTADARKAKAAAIDTLDNGDKAAADERRRVDVAIVQMVRDEFNLHADKINSILDAIDGAATLAAMKTAIAAIPNYPTRTAQQVRDAIVSKINATAE